MAAGSVLWILAMVNGAQQAKAAGKGYDTRYYQILMVLTVCKPRPRLGACL